MIERVYFSHKKDSSLLENRNMIFLATNCLVCQKINLAYG
jgi:hypothetical protein